MNERKSRKGRLFVVLHAVAQTTAFLVMHSWLSRYANYFLTTFVKTLLVVPPLASVAVTVTVLPHRHRLSENRYQ
jgi:hypothetical protein